MTVRGGRQVLGIVLAAAFVSVIWYWTTDPGPEVETAVVTLGDYTDIVEIRGEVRPIRSTYVNAPARSGELLIIRIARSGTRVKAGDVIVEFDAVTIKRTIEEKKSELRTARAELAQATAQASIREKEAEATVIRAQYDVDRAHLALGNIDLVSVVEAERNRLALADAERRLEEAEVAFESARRANEADRTARERRIEKVESDLADAERSATALQIVAPIDGTVHVMPNYRSIISISTGSAPEYRAGDRTYANASILELPDLSSVFLVARIDEADRSLLQQGQHASVRVDAVADRDYQATVSDISLLARMDYSGGWPPPKQFDLKLAFEDPDDRLQTGMNTAARIDVGKLENVLLVPAAAVHVVDGVRVVHVVRRSGAVPVPVDVVRQGREQAVIVGDVSAGDVVALTAPEETEGGGR